MKYGTSKFPHDVVLREIDKLQAGAVGRYARRQTTHPPWPGNLMYSERLIARSLIQGISLSGPRGKEKREGLSKIQAHPSGPVPSYETRRISVDSRSWVGREEVGATCLQLR